MRHPCLTCRDRSRSPRAEPRQSSGLRGRSASSSQSSSIVDDDCLARGCGVRNLRSYCRSLLEIQQPCWNANASDWSKLLDCFGSSLALSDASRALLALAVWHSPKVANSPLGIPPHKWRIAKPQESLLRPVLDGRWTSSRRERPTSHRVRNGIATRREHRLAVRSH